MFTRLLVSAPLVVACLIGCAPTEDKDPVPVPEGSQTVKDGCVVSGCGEPNTSCGDEPLGSDCWTDAWDDCYRGGVCERQEDGHCAWSPTLELLECLEGYGAPDEVLTSP